jgi:hypothetical protein
MNEAKACCMQCLPPETAQGLGEFGGGSFGDPQPPAIDGVTDQGVAYMGHVDPDLVGPARPKQQAQMGMGRKAPGHLIESRGRPAILHDRHFHPRQRMAAQGGIHLSAGDDPALDHGDVFPADGACLYLGHELPMGGQGARHDQQPAGILVEAMYDPRPG